MLVERLPDVLTPPPHGRKLHAREVFVVLDPLTAEPRRDRLREEFLIDLPSRLARPPPDQVGDVRRDAAAVTPHAPEDRCRLPRLVTLHVVRYVRHQPCDID